MKGIILAGGKGSRLYPLTKSISKNILPIYDKPTIYYPLSILMLANIRDILIISTPRDINLYKNLFNNGSQIGLNITYKIQKYPRGLADAFILGEKFIGNDNVSLILGDNILYGETLPTMLEEINNDINGAVIFGYPVNNPSSYGVVEFDDDNNVISLEEKPENPKSNYAIPGLYFYDNKVINIAKNIKPSKRGEIEITDVNIEYLKNNNLKVKLLDKTMTWIDTGTYESLLKAGNFIKTLQEHKNTLIGSIEKIAYLKGYINQEQLLNLLKKMYKTKYKDFLESIIKNNGGIMNG